MKTENTRNAGRGLALLVAATLMAFIAQPISTSAAPKGNAQAGVEQPTAAGGGVGEGGSDAVSLLRKIEAKYGHLNTVAGTFRQEMKQEGPMAPKKPIQMSARFSMQKPNKFRADYTNLNKTTQPSATAAAYPYDSTNLVVGDEAKHYVRDLGQVSTYRFKSGANVRDLNYLLLGFGAHTDEVLRVYNVTSGKAPRGYRSIVLTPRSQSDAGFKSISMLVTDDENLLPFQFTLVHQDNSRVTVTMDTSNLRIGGGIERGTFEDNFPKSAERVKVGG